MPTTRTVTVKSSGGDYTSLAAAEAGEQGDLVSLDRLLVIECYASAAGDNTPVHINGWTTDSTRYIQIVSPIGERHVGVWDASKYYLTFATSGTPGGVVRVQEDYTRIEYLQIENTALSPGQYNDCIYTDGTNCTTDGCITRGGYYGISTMRYLRNTVCYGAARAGAFSSTTSGYISYVQNCTLIGAIYGIEPNSSVDYTILQNVYAHGGTAGIFGQGQAGGFATKINCASSDTTATNNGGGGGATNCLASVAHSTANFGNITSGSEDYRLTSGSALIDVGFDLSGTFTNSISGTTRPQNSIYDIGADEYAASSGVTESRAGSSTGLGNQNSPAAISVASGPTGTGSGSASSPGSIGAAITAFANGIGTAASVASIVVAVGGYAIGCGSGSSPATTVIASAPAAFGIGTGWAPAAITAEVAPPSDGIGTGHAPTDSNNTISVAGSSYGIGTAWAPAQALIAATGAATGYGTGNQPGTITVNLGAAITGYGSVSAIAAQKSESAPSITGYASGYAPGVVTISLAPSAYGIGSTHSPAAVLVGSYGSSTGLGTPNAPTELGDYPEPSDVRAGVEYTIGGPYPLELDVRFGVVYAGGTMIGTLVLPDESDVRAGTEYGSDGEFIGTLSLERRNLSGPSGLMNHTAFVLEFRLKPVTNMDAKRVYYRRTTTDENGKKVKEKIPCRVSVVSSNELVLHSMRGSEMSHRVYFVSNPNLREENRLEINGVQYILVGLPQNPSQDGRLWQLDVRAVTHQNEKVEILE